MPIKKVWIESNNNHCPYGYNHQIIDDGDEDSLYCKICDLFFQKSKEEE